jgi:hypothetical protein
MLGQIGLLQVDEGYTYKDFLILFAAAWTIELDLVSSDYTVTSKCQFEPIRTSIGPLASKGAGNEPDVSMEVVELVEGDVVVVAVRHQPLCLQIRDPGTHRFTVRRVRRLPICNRQPSAHAQGPWAADVRGVAAHGAS